MARKDALNENKKKLQKQLSCTNLEMHRIDSIKQAVAELKITEEVNEELLRSNIEQIVIEDGTATFIFKCGVEFTKPIKQGK